MCLLRGRFRLFSGCTITQQIKEYTFWQTNLVIKATCSIHRSYVPITQTISSSGGTSRVGTLYVDGHVRVYHSAKTKLPRKYVSRQRLCLRGTTDYWVNGLGGAPFFVITQPVNPGLVAVLREQIVPRLLNEAPSPDAATLARDPRAVRFTVVVDREGFSPALMAELQAQRVGFLTYQKSPGEPWPGPANRNSDGRARKAPGRAQGRATENHPERTAGSRAL